MSNAQPRDLPHDQHLQAEGLACPMPLLKTKLALKTMAAGSVLWVSATDSGSWRDLHTFVELTSHQMLAAEQRDDVYHYWIQKGE
ncbi:sulfurtransferase TusA family protein [Bacterioplanes sanyensis]|uniref:sulfurtransferase TusA family protein n=1 Tax=Bacterioplanes sanyensis TaxID=1249553 RepID=UPI001E350559|nr:sulfurtransferase TusA family protein [Bacterioplanes sanyensis]